MLLFDIWLLLIIQTILCRLLVLVMFLTLCISTLYQRGSVSRWLRLGETSSWSMKLWGKAVKGNSTYCRANHGSFLYTTANITELGAFMNVWLDPGCADIFGQLAWRSAFKMLAPLVEELIAEQENSPMRRQFFISLEDVLYREEEIYGGGDLPEWRTEAMESWGLLMWRIRFEDFRMARIVRCNDWWSMKWKRWARAERQRSDGLTNHHVRLSASVVETNSIYSD